MKIVLLTVCEGAAIDQGTNRVTLFNVFDILRASAFPVQIPACSFVVIMEREKSDDRIVQSKLYIRLNDIEIAQTSLNMDFSDKQRARAITVIYGLGVASPGILSFSVEWDGDKSEVWQIPVESAGPDVIQKMELADPSTQTSQHDNTEVANVSRKRKGKPK